ncbi:hypothetical protein ACSLBF_12225 [Pseudoalteromonas sp. T1lg65]|uniref:hypothetical protein n=1 Tax=Pseudoalteromonas sp. T1lg65 TaxID=2077101 RepID=UPI003F7B0C0B
MKQSQGGGVKISAVIISVLLLGVGAWFNQANATVDETAHPNHVKVQSSHSNT